MMRREMLILKKSGWKIFRISYDEANDDTEFKFLEMIGAEPKHKKQLKEKVISYAKYKNDIKNQIKLNNKKEFQNLIEKRKQIVLNSTDIDFSKYGWIQKLCKKLNFSNVGRWIKKYMPDFYREKCFKRKTHKIIIT